MNAKLFIIVILLTIVIATLFNISGVIREIKVNQFYEYSENAKKIDTVGQNLDTVKEAAAAVDKSRDIETLFIVIMVSVQVISLVAFIIQDERKVSFPIIFLILGVTLLPIQYIYAPGPNNTIEVHHINMWHMEYIEGENSRVNLKSEFFASNN